MKNFVFCIRMSNISGQLHTRTIPLCTGVGLHERFYWLVVVLVGSGPMDLDPGGQ